MPLAAGKNSDPAQLDNFPFWWPITPAVLLKMAGPSPQKRLIFPIW